MPIVIRHCLICGEPMAAIRSTKWICSRRCHTSFHRQRNKLDITNKEMLQLLKQQQQKEVSEIEKQDMQELRT